MTWSLGTFLGTEVLTGTAKVDTITITDVTLNRGKCAPAKLELPKTLKFGDSIQVVVVCSVKELEVKSSEGELTYSWE
jgi:hypothetical protein